MVGTLEKTIALTHHVYVEKTMEVKTLHYQFFYKKQTKKNYCAILIFRSFATFFGLTIFRSSTKQKFLFTEFMSVLEQNARIDSRVPS